MSGPLVIRMAAECNEVFHGGCPCTLGEIEKLNERVQTLRLALAGYGDHDPSCTWRLATHIPAGTIPRDLCNCGFSAALSE